MSHYKNADANAIHSFLGSNLLWCSSKARLKIDLGTKTGIQTEKFGSRIRFEEYNRIELVGSISLIQSKNLNFPNSMFSIN